MMLRWLVSKLAKRDEPEIPYECAACGQTYRFSDEGLERPKCYRPKDHRGACGEPRTSTEAEDRILYGQCGAPPAPTHVLHASDKGTRWL
jgi:hypothetical protein